MMGRDVSVTSLICLSQYMHAYGKLPYCRPRLPSQ